MPRHAGPGRPGTTAPGTREIVTAGHEEAGAVEEDDGIEQAQPSDDGALADHYLALWQGYGVPPDHLLPDARERVLAFLAAARAGYELGGFLCRKDGAVVASAGCSVRRAPYPEVILPQYRKVGYVFGLYVEPAYRRRGLARRLTAACLDHLRAIGCQTAILHSSEAGRPLYQAMGFEPTSELRLVL